MPFVLLVVALTAVMGVCYLTTTTSSTPAARLTDDRLQARLVAESGMASSLARLRTEDGWRATAAEGAWLRDAALPGGSFTVELFDGEDVDGDVGSPGTELEFAL